MQFVQKRSTPLLTGDQIAAYRRDGFLVVPEFFSVAELEPLRQAYDADPTVRGRLYGMVDLAGKGHPFCTWVDLGDDIIGIIPRMARMVQAAEDLLGEPCYHWHSKFSIKTRGCEARVEWHQDYTSWYNDGVLFPHMLTVGIAVTPATRANGCVQFVPGSQHMGRVGAISMVHPNTEDFYNRLARAKLALGIVHAEMDVGDAVFFHCNTLHGSDLNSTNDARVMIFSSYNAIANAPLPDVCGINDEGAYMGIGYAERTPKPLERLPDDALIERRFKSAFSHTRFNDPVWDLEGAYSKAARLADPGTR